MSSRQKSSLAELLAIKKPARATAAAEAVTAQQRTPFFDQLVDRVGGTEKQDFENLLSEMTGPVDPATLPQFPTAHCLSPEDVYASESLGREQQLHLGGCPWCKNMVRAAQPSDDEFESLLRKCRATATAEMAYRDNDDEIAAC